MMYPKELLHIQSVNFANLNWRKIFFSENCKRQDGSLPFLHKPILHTLGPTQPIQHTIVSSRAYYSTSVVLHEAIMYDTGNRSNTAFLHMIRYSTRRYCTGPVHHKPITHVPDSTQPVSTHQFFDTTRFYTSVFLHKSGPAPPFPVSAHKHISGRKGRKALWLTYTISLA